MTDTSSTDSPAGDIVTFDFAKLTPRERYKLLIGAVGGAGAISSIIVATR